jgi:hypothetical protein
MAAILTAQPPSLTDLVGEVPPELDRWITHCLEKNPGERFQSARDLAFALRTLLSGAPTHPKAIASLAVLPFSTAGDNPDSEYLCDGITETIINSLAQLPGLRVIARSTVFIEADREAPDFKTANDVLRLGRSGALRRDAAGCRHGAHGRQ